MKTTRLAAYAIAGVIAGLLIENTALRMSKKAGSKARDLKKKANKGFEKMTA